MQRRDSGFLPSRSVRNSRNIVRSGRIYVRSGLIYVRKRVKRCALASFVCGRLFYVLEGFVENVSLRLDLGWISKLFIDSYTFSKIKTAFDLCSGGISGSFPVVLCGIAGIWCGLAQFVCALGLFMCGNELNGALQPLLCAEGFLCPGGLLKMCR